MIDEARSRSEGLEVARAFIVGNRDGDGPGDDGPVAPTVGTETPPDYGGAAPPSNTTGCTSP